MLFHGLHFFLIVMWASAAPKADVNVNIDIDVNQGPHASSYDGNELPCIPETCTYNGTNGICAQDFPGGFIFRGPQECGNSAVSASCNCYTPDPSCPGICILLWQPICVGTPNKRIMETFSNRQCFDEAVRCDAAYKDFEFKHHGECICQLQKVEGPCFAAIPSYYYNWDLRQCLNFTYGGCDGNANRFDTYDECQSRCASYIPDLTTDAPSPAAKTAEEQCLSLSPPGIWIVAGTEIVTSVGNMTVTCGLCGSKITNISDANGQCCQPELGSGRCKAPGFSVIAGALYSPTCSQCGAIMADHQPPCCGSKCCQTSGER